MYNGLPSTWTENIFTSALKIHHLKKASMKKNAIFLCSLMICIASFASASVNEKVLKSFKETFPTAEEVKWQEFSDNYIVNFVEGGVRNRINYDKDGNLLSATRYYGQENLPVNILCKIKKKYPDAKVFGVTELETEASVEYYIKLEDETNWITVKSDMVGNTAVVEKYKKAPSTGN
jgi:hypothetical protein